MVLDVDVVRAESLVHEEILRSYGEHFLHINLSHSVNIEFIVFPLRVLEVVLLATYLVQIHPVDRYAHCVRFLRIQNRMVEQYLDEFSMLTGEIVGAVHAHLLSDLQFIVDSIVHALIRSDLIDFGEPICLRGISRAREPLNHEFHIGLVADRVGRHYLLLLLLIRRYIVFFIQVMVAVRPQEIICLC